MNDLGLLLQEGLLVPNNDRATLSRILREGNGRDGLAVLAAQNFNFGFEEYIETGPHQ